MPSDIYNLQLCFMLISKDLPVIQGETEMKIVMIHGQNHQGSPAILEDGQMKECRQRE